MLATGVFSDYLLSVNKGGQNYQRGCNGRGRYRDRNGEKDGRYDGAAPEATLAIVRGISCVVKRQLDTQFRPQRDDECLARHTYSHAMKKAFQNRGEGGWLGVFDVMSKSTLTRGHNVLLMSE